MEETIGYQSTIAEEIFSLPFIIPPDVQDNEDLRAIDGIAKENARIKHRLFINRTWEANTITYTVVETILKVLSESILRNGIGILSDEADNTIDFYDLLQVVATYKKNEKAEKVGNINVKFFAGSRVNEIISDDTPTGQEKIEYMEAKAAYSFPENASLTDAMLKIDNAARRHLKDKFSILLPNSFNAIAIAYVFLEALYRHLVTKLVRSEKNSVMINFNDIIEFHALRKEGNTVDIRLRPGMEAKLIIKSDQTTEDEDDGNDSNYTNSIDHYLGR